MNNVIDSILLSGTTYACGGFKVQVNPSADTKVGIINSLAEYFDTNIGNKAVIEGDGVSSSRLISASGDESHAEGASTTASGHHSHAEGRYSTASGSYSHAEGNAATASGNTSHAEGNTTKAYGSNSHAEGQRTSATSDSSHAEGAFTIANGQSSHAEGNATKAYGSNSHAEGNSTLTNNQSEHASGEFNVSSSGSSTFGDSGNTLFSVGNGTANNARHNAFEIRQNGDIYISDVNATGEYYEKPMIKLQDAIGEAGISSGEVQTMIDQSISGKANSSDVYTKSETSGATEIQTALNAKVNTSDFNTYSANTQTAINGKQDTLVSGTNIKTINNESILGSGNIDIQGGGKAIEAGRGISITTGETADTVSFNLPISATTDGSILIGVSCSANRDKSFVGGQGSIGQSEGSFAFGQYCKASQWSIAVGNGVEANISPNSAAFGKYNKQNGGFSEADSATTLFSVGNGKSTSARHNAFEIRQNGDIYITSGGTDIKLQDQLGGGSVTVSSAITSGDTNAVAGGAVYDKFDEVEQVTARALIDVNEKFDGLKLKKITQAAYDALTTKDANTLYIITS